MPSAKYVAKDVFDKVIAFIKRAGSVILICSIVIWFLVSFSFNMNYDVNIEESMLATIGNKISWVFEPMLGTRSWGATVSAIQGLVAKEQVVSSMAVINGLADDVEVGEEIFSSNGVVQATAHILAKDLSYQPQYRFEYKQNSLLDEIFANFCLGK